MALVIPHGRGLAVANTQTGRPVAAWGTTVTASATPHALTGTRTQLVASTSYEAEWIEVTVQNTRISATNTDSLLNIYIGAGGSEVLLIDSLVAGWANEDTIGAGGRRFWFPLRISRGTRISAELRALITVDTVSVGIRYGVSNGMHWVGSGVETLGEDTAASEGTDVTPGDAAEGAWTTIATTGRRYRYIIPGVMGNNDTTLLSLWMACDIGTGSATYQGLDNFLTADDSGEGQANGSPVGYWCDIPSGTALQARLQSSGTASGLQTVCLYGVY